MKLLLILFGITFFIPVVMGAETAQQIGVEKSSETRHENLNRLNNIFIELFKKKPMGAAGLLGVVSPLVAFRALYVQRKEYQDELKKN